MSVREHEESFSHMNWPHRVLTLTPLKDFGMRWKRLKEWFDYPVIKTKYVYPKPHPNIRKNLVGNIFQLNGDGLGMVPSG